MVEFKIEVTLTPHPWDNQAAPYYWAILKWDDFGGWYNVGGGWAATPKDAYTAAETYYNDNINDKEDK